MIYEPTDLQLLAFEIALELQNEVEGLNVIQLHMQGETFNFALRLASGVKWEKLNVVLRLKKIDFSVFKFRPLRGKKPTSLPLGLTAQRTAT